MEGSGNLQEHTLERLPRVILPGRPTLDTIGDALTESREVVLYRQATSEAPYTLEVTANLLQAGRERRLQMAASFALNASVDNVQFSAIKTGFRRYVGEAPFAGLGISHKQVNCDKLSTSFKQRGSDRRNEIVAWFGSPRSRPFALFAANQRSDHNGAIMATAPEFDHAILPEDISNFMQLLSLPHRALGATVSEYTIDFIEERTEGKRRNRQQTQVTRSKKSPAKTVPAPDSNRALRAKDDNYRVDETYDPTIRLDDVYGLDPHTLKKIRRTIKAFKNPELAAEHNIASTGGILALGEPGNGKTMLGYAVANELGATIWQVRSSDLTGEFAGGTAPLTDGFFQSAIERSKLDPLMILLDEFESIAGATEKRGDTSERTILNGSVKRYLGVIAKAVPALLPFGTTNNVSRLDPAIIRQGRFNIHAYMTAPNEAARLGILWSHLGRTKHAPDIYHDVWERDTAPHKDKNWAQIIKETNGFSGAVLAEIVQECCAEKFEEHLETGIRPAPITPEDILRNVIVHRQQSHVFHDKPEDGESLSSC